MEAPEAAVGSKRTPVLADNRPAPQEDAPAVPSLPADLRRKRSSQSKEQDALALARPEPSKPAWTAPREVPQQRQGPEIPGSRRTSRNQPPAKPPERPADVKPPLPDGGVAPKKDVESRKAKGPQPANKEQSQMYVVAPQAQRPQQGRMNDTGSRVPSYMRESLYADQTMTWPCVFCAVGLLILMSMALIFFLFKSTEMVAAMERTTTTTAAQTTRTSHGRAMSEATTLANKRQTSPHGEVPWVTDDGSSSEKELDDTEASITTTIDGDGDEAQALAV